MVKNEFYSQRVHGPYETVGVGDLVLEAGGTLRQCSLANLEAPYSDWTAVELHGCRLTGLDPRIIAYVDRGGDDLGTYPITPDERHGGRHERRTLPHHRGRRLAAPGCAASRVRAPITTRCAARRRSGRSQGASV